MKELTSNKQVLDFVEQTRRRCRPDSVVWIDGSQELYDKLTAEAISTGEMIKLNEDLLPGCLLHRTKENDVARVENRTFICSRKEEDCGPTNNWWEPSKSFPSRWVPSAVGCPR